MQLLIWIISALVALLFLFLSLAIFYLFLLAASWWSSRSRPGGNIPLQKKFAILIPAHNEEAVITQCLKSIQNLNYYEQLYQTFVIADNCSDATAEVAKEYPVTVWERHDSEKRGKGFALAWALARLNLNDFDAVVILDADCMVQENLLLAFNQRLLSGQIVLQAHDGIYNFRRNFLTYLLYLGSLVENSLFYGGREVLQLSSFLRGTGMCFSAAVLQKYAWESFSETEDLEFSLKLLVEGIRVNLVPETGVLAIQPTKLQAAYTQKKRWAKGTFSLIRRNFAKLLGQGIRKWKFGPVEAAFALLLLSRPLLLYLNLLGIFLALAIFSSQEQTLFWWGIVLLIAQVLYLGSSIFLASDKIKALRSLLLAPFYLLWLLLVQLTSLKGGRKPGWEKTARENAKT